MADETFVFGSFRLIPAERMLFDDGKPLRLGSRALDILISLVERAGETLTREQLIARTWPDTVVDEGALRVHIAALRKALGDGRAGRRYIANIPARGYSFVAPVTREQRQPAIASTNGAAEPGNLPAPLTRIVGRDDVIAALAAQLRRRRLLTIVGPGGIGKTTVAVAAAESVSASYDDGVWFVGLASLPDPDLVASALGTVLGISLPGANPISGLAGWLRDKHALIVLDSCEHVIDAAAAIAEAILKAAAHVSILATSREPLRAEGEWVHRLSSLELPPRSDDLSPDGALRYSAVQLFNERARAIMDGFALDGDDIAPVIEICHRLDGMPLALELAAARVDVFGVKGLAARLDNRFAVLTSGRRTALPRHQTLRAAIDWSYELLPETEQIILRRVAVFQGDFTIDAAAAVVTDRIGTADVFEAIANLAAKSLISTDISSDVTYHRLLDTTRAYALEKLADSGECERLARRHAEYFRDLFESAETEWDTRPTAEWLADYGRQIDDLRAALDWAFSPRGNASVGVALTVAAVPLWFQLSLVDECLGWVERALAALDMAPRPNERRQMQLHAALGWLQMYATARLESSTAAWRTALRLAEELGDTDYQLRALWALWADRTNHAEFREALTLASQFRSLSARAGNAADQLVGDRMTGASLHFLGDQAGARECIERMLGRYTTPVHRSHAVRFQFDQRVTARITLARVLWLQGFADQALREVESNIEHAVSINHTLSLCNALAQGACPIALLVGDFAMAERYTAMLRSHTGKNTLDVWRAYADCFDGERLIRCGDLQTGLSLLRPAVDELWRAGFVQYHTPFAVALASGLLHVGHVADARATIDKALERCERTGESWALAELYRARGKTLRSARTSSANQAAEVVFLQSLDIAHEQKVLSWELRAATSLAQLWRDQQRGKEARELLGSVYGRFTEGFATADLRKARSLLEQLA